MKKGYLIIGSIVTIISIIGLSAHNATAASTPSILDGGVCINEILINPKSSTSGFDTDSNGAIDDLDEFIELYNLSTKNIDISGWELWDSLALNWYSFPGSPDDGTTLLKPGAYAVVVSGVQAGGSLPAMTNPDSLIFDAGLGSPTMNNTSDNVVLYDPGDDEYVQLLYNGDGPDDPTSSYPGFSSTAVRVSSIEDFGFDQDGVSLVRNPSGDSNIDKHTAIPGAGDASPTSIKLVKLNAFSSSNIKTNQIILLGIIIMIITGLRFFRKR